jgi:hypothetical protein
MKIIEAVSVSYSDAHTDVCGKVNDTFLAAIHCEHTKELDCFVVLCCRNFLCTWKFSIHFFAMHEL